VTRILIVEDEPSLADSIRYALTAEGFECHVLAEGSGALDYVRSWRPDLVLLDLMLPGRTGTDICREIRTIGRTPIVIVTAKDSEADKVLGLELGADDYITKPFSMRELIARVRAVLRRGSDEPVLAQPATSVAAGPVQIDTERHEVRINGVVAELPPKEFALLEVLARRVGKLMTRERLIAEVWGEDYYGDTRTLDVHIKRLRAKIEDDPRNPRHLRTVRGLGYRFEP
jgi:two-component system response regulator RegX3